MIDEKGIMYIIDLGTAKILDVKTHNRTFTIIGKYYNRYKGTPHYMAPEVFA